MNYSYYGGSFFNFLSILQNGKEMRSIIIILGSVVCASLGQIAMKKGMLCIGFVSLKSEDLISTIITIFSNRYVLLGLIFYVASMFLWLVALSRAQLSYVYPFTILTFVFVMLACWLIFKEAMPILRIIGILLIFLGIFLIAKS